MDPNLSFVALTEKRRELSDKSPPNAMQSRCIMQILSIFEQQKFRQTDH
jgi:hypothetical protein